MSSHREAPEISKDPVADSTDVYAFVSPSKPDHVVLIANYVPLQAPDGGPNFYEFGDDVTYEIHVSNSGKSTADISYQFRFTTEIRNPKTFLYNIGPITSIGDKNWNRPQFYSVTRVENGRRRQLAGKLACPPVNVGPRSTPDYAKLSSQAVHKLGRGRGLRRSACRRLPRRPRQHLRPRGPAPAQRGAPDPVGQDGRHQLRPGVQRPLDRDRGARSPS